MKLDTESQKSRLIVSHSTHGQDARQGLMNQDKIITGILDRFLKDEAYREFRQSQVTQKQSAKQWLTWLKKIILTRLRMRSSIDTDQSHWTLQLIDPTFN